MERVAFVLLLLYVSAVSAVDKTRVVKEIGLAVVEATVDAIELSCIFSDDALMLRRIAYAETRDGEDPDTFGNATYDYYGGIWRVDKDMFDATKTATTHFTAIEAAFNIVWSDLSWDDLWSPLYSGLAARIYLEMQLSSIPRSEEGQAEAWVTDYKGALSGDSQLTARYLDAVNKTAKECAAPRADIIFVLDASGSIGAGNFELVKGFVAAVVLSFDVSQTKVRIGVLKYSRDANIEFHLDEHSNKTEIADIVRDITYTGGGTQTDDALLLMEEMFAERGRGHDGVPQICVFLTDGQSTEQAETLKAAAQIHKTQITVFSVGITSGVDQDELNAIGTDPDCVHVFLLTTFDEIAHFARQIEDLTCNAPAELKEGQVVSGQLFQLEVYYFKISVRKEDGGATVLPKVNFGVLTIYLSWNVRGPGPAVHDVTFTIDDSEEFGGVYVPWDDTYDDDERELYGSLYGVDPITLYLMRYEGGWYNGASTLSAVRSITVFMLTLLDIMLIL